MLISPCSSRCLIVRALPGSLPLALSFLSCCNALGSSEGLRTVRFPSRSWTGIIQELGELKETRRGGERCRNGAGAMDFQSYANLPVSHALSWRLGAILFPFDFSPPFLLRVGFGLLGSVPTSCKGLQTRGSESPPEASALLSRFQGEMKAAGTGTADAEWPRLPAEHGFGSV